MTARIIKKDVKFEISIKDNYGNIVETYECDYIDNEQMLCELIEAILKAEMSKMRLFVICAIAVVIPWGIILDTSLEMRLIGLAINIIGFIALVYWRRKIM